MIPIVWKEYIATVSGATYKFVDCEKCQQKNVYRMVRVGQGLGSSLYYLDNEGAQSRAQGQAQAELQKQLASDCDPVPCPKCGWYQVDMIEKIRSEYRIWMNWWAFGLLFAFIPLALVGWLCFVGARQFPIVGSVSGGLAGLCMLTILGLFFHRRFAASQFEPNDAPQEERIYLGQTKAEKVETFEAWVHQYGIKAAPD